MGIPISIPLWRSPSPTTCCSHSALPRKLSGWLYPTGLFSPILTGSFERGWSQPENHQEGKPAGLPDSHCSQGTASQALELLSLSFSGEYWAFLAFTDFPTSIGFTLDPDRECLGVRKMKAKCSGVRTDPQKKPVTRPFYHQAKNTLQFSPESLDMAHTFPSLQHFTVKILVLQGR